MENAPSTPRSCHSHSKWGQERIANELLLKLGLRVSPRTMGKYVIITCDFFVAVTSTFRVCTCSSSSNITVREQRFRHYAHRYLDDPSPASPTRIVSMAGCVTWSFSPFISRWARRTPVSKKGEKTRASSHKLEARCDVRSLRPPSSLSSNLCVPAKVRESLIEAT
jgi:hypothetical protein